MTDKLHPADAADIEKIATATHFNVHLRTGPTEKINREAKTLAEAAAIADEIGKTAGGKKPMIYAVTPEGFTVMVPTDMIADERELANQGNKRLSGDKVDATPARKRKSRTGRQEARKEAATGARKGKAASDGSKAARRATIAENAAKGILPPVPDFSAATHARFRGKLAEIVKLVEAGDVAALKAIEIKTYSSSPRAMDRYRNLAVAALEAKAD